MPIYEFRCSGCGKKIEFVLLMKDRGSPQACPECQASMSRLVELPQSSIIPWTGRDQVLADLNSKNDGRGNYPHHKAAIWKGLNQRPEVAGRGF